MTKPPTVAYVNGEWKLWADATVHISTHALHYGLGVFGGTRAYWMPEDNDMFLFRLDDHIERLLRGCEAFGFRGTHWGETIDREFLRRVYFEAIKRNNLREDAYIRPEAFTLDHEDIIGVDPTHARTGFTIFAMGFPVGSYMSQTEPAKVMVSNKHRQLPRDTITRTLKISGAYALSASVYLEVKPLGFKDGILLNHDGSVSEGASSNLFIVKNDEVITPSEDSNILPGITRRTLIEIAPELGITVTERRVYPTDLYDADEFFLTGTAAQIGPVGQIGDVVARNFKERPITGRFQEEFGKIVRNEHPRSKEWLTPVYV